jgi:hypothetical protein
MIDKMKLKVIRKKEYNIFIFELVCLNKLFSFIFRQILQNMFFYI